MKSDGQCQVAARTSVVGYLKRPRKNTHQLKHAQLPEPTSADEEKDTFSSPCFSLEAGRVTVEGYEKEASSSWQCAVQWPLSQFEALRRCSGRHSLAIHSSAASAWRLVLATDDVCPLSQGPLDGSRAFAPVVGGRCQAAGQMVPPLALPLEEMPVECP